MRTLRAESVFVGDIVDSVSDVGFWIDISETTADGQASIFLTGVHQLGGLLMGLTVRQLVTVIISVNANVVQRGVLYENCLAVIRRRGCESNSHKSAESNDLEAHRTSIR